MDAACCMDESKSVTTELWPSTREAELRLGQLVDEQYDFVWRSLRRLGVRDGDADDAAQQVFLVVARKLDSIREGCERSFLYQTALRVASDYRRSHVRRFESSLSDLPQLHELEPNTPSSDELLDMRRARVLLDAVLGELSAELRAVFVLHELEQTTMAEIATLLNLASGTVASRLRRARAEFVEILERHQRSSLGELS